ncbi:hypothetical protein [Streptomyces sp. NPDC050263]|uniref:hypothetical protein n=1 Tax=Streptomyces sp. NPDC050263 TaxID=3155037 RepID=UPI00344964BD
MTDPPPAARVHKTIEDRLREHNRRVRIPPGLLRRLYGLEERIVADESTLATDLASRAVRRALKQAAVAPSDIDLLLSAPTSWNPPTPTWWPPVPD